MQKAIIGKKVGMTQIFDAEGKVIPVTVIEAGPCVVTQIKTVEKEGYNAIQLGFEDVQERKLNKPPPPGLLHLPGGRRTGRRRIRRGRLRGRDRHLQGQGLRGRYQALERGPLPDEPRRWPDAPPSGFHGRLL